MNIVAAECAVKKHHPEWSNVSLSHDFSEKFLLMAENY